MLCPTHDNYTRRDFFFAMLWFCLTSFFCADGINLMHHYTYYIVNILRFGYVISDILPNGRICIQNSQCLIHCTIWSNGSGLGPKAELAIKFWIILKIFFFDFLDRNLWIILNVNKFILSNDRIQRILGLGSTPILVESMFVSLMSFRSKNYYYWNPTLCWRFAV